RVAGRSRRPGGGCGPERAPGADRSASRRPCARTSAPACRPKRRTRPGVRGRYSSPAPSSRARGTAPRRQPRSEEHTSELQSRFDLVCRLLLEKKKKKRTKNIKYKPRRD